MIKFLIMHKHKYIAKVLLSLCLVNRHTMKMFGVEVQLHTYLTLALDGGECSAS
jgi:hypothetical protein